MSPPDSSLGGVSISGENHSNSSPRGQVNRQWAVRWSITQQRKRDNFEPCEREHDQVPNPRLGQKSKLETMMPGIIYTNFKTHRLYFV